MWHNTLVVDLLFYKLLICRLIVTYFVKLRLHQIAPLLFKIFRGGGGGGGGGRTSPDPPSTSVNQHHNRADFSPGM